MKTLQTSAAFLLLLVGASTACAQDAIQVSGLVVNSEGQPVPGIRVGTGWAFQGSAASARWRSDARSRQNPEVRSDSTGSFSAGLYFRGRPVAIYALDMKSRRGGISIIDKDNLERECLLKLRPLVRLHGRITIDDPALRGSAVYIYAFDPRAPIAICSHVSKASDFEMHLPPGRYEFSFAGKDLGRVKRQVLVDAGQRDLDMGAVGLFATNLANHYGKPPPPWNITAARGVSKEIRLSDYQGKWVLIEFWSYW